jgi:hypothetical protein
MSSPLAPFLTAHFNCALSLTHRDFKFFNINLHLQLLPGIHTDFARRVLRFDVVPELTELSVLILCLDA